MKRIVFTVTNDLTYDRRMQRICTALVSDGYEVLLVGRKLPNSLPQQPQQYDQKRIRCTFNKGKLFYLEFNLRLYFYLRKSQRDIFSAVDLDTIIPVFLAAGFKGKKRVYDAHEYFSEVPEVVNRPFTKKVWETVASIFIPKADAAYTVGQGLADIFTKRYKKAFDTVRNVPDLIESTPAPIEDRKFILYQGALNVGRGLEELIQAMHHIDMPLKIAGEGDLSTQLREQVKREGLENKIEFLGFVKPADLPALTKGAFVGYNLLQNMGLSYYYSLANKSFDYIHAGVPTLNMDFPEYVAINQQYEVSILMKELKPEAIVEAVNSLIQQPEKYRRLSDNCLLAKKEFNWQKEQQKLLNLYRGL